MEIPQLTEQERAEILSEIHQREFLEKAAIEQEKKARAAEAERHHRESLALEARKAQEERKERLLSNLSGSIKLIQQALEAFQGGNESECYRLLVKADPCLINVKHQLNQQPISPSVGSIPTVRVKRDTVLGFAVINASDLLPTDVVLEDKE